MTDVRKKRFITVFATAAATQAIGFPAISWLFGLGDRLHAPSWVVIVLTSGTMAALAASTVASEGR